MAQAHVDERQGRGADQRRAQELAELPQEPGAGDGGGDPQAGHCLLRPGERRPETIHPVVRELAADATRPMPVATGCGVLGVSTSGYHAGDTRRLSGRDLEQAHLMGRDPRRERRLLRQSTLGYLSRADHERAYRTGRPTESAA